MKIAIVAPSPVPFLIGGAERLWWGLLDALNRRTPHDAELIKLPSPERGFWELMESYRTFARLDLGHFDLVISTKYPAWMVAHPNHYCYMQHKLRGLYDTYRFAGLPTRVAEVPAALGPLMDMLERSRGARSELAPFFDLLFRLRDDPTLPPHTFAFPGPLARRIVHFLDAIALSPRSIRRYCAISRTVAERADYFPPGVEVAVIHHPSNLPRFENDGYRYLFTASRLDGPKRVDLLIEAFRRVQHPIELHIAGTGPAEEGLRALARDDPRVRFLGRIDDDTLIRAYAGALFVPFVPYAEDYGLITLEAMASGKAVLTTSDAGGVTELVTHGETGMIAAPDAESLGRAMDLLIADTDRTRAMGKRAQERVGAIDWDHTIGALLADGPGPPGTRARRKRWVVAVDFPVYPPRGGGQSRIFHLYKALARRLEVTLVTLCEDANAAGEFAPAPGLREVRICKSQGHLAAQRALEERLGSPVGDIATLLHWDLTPEYGRILAGEMQGSDLLIASHPYLYPALAELGAERLWYEAHNVELDMKRAVLAETAEAEAEPFLTRVRQTEQAICSAAERVMVCAEADTRRMVDLYGIDPAKCLLVPNGVDARAVRFAAGATRRAAKTRLGLDGRFAVLFVGSWHQPNIEALRRIKAFAAACPEVDFLVAGSLCLHPEVAGRPANLYPLGVLEDGELDAILAAADLAVNPITSGSGTNLKMLHYAAAGVPILSTPFGNRGLEWTADEDLFVAQAAAFPEAIRRIRSLSASRIGMMVSRTRERVEAQFDWPVIADRLALGWSNGSGRRS